MSTPLLLADRGLVPIEVTGPDRLSYLDDVMTQQFGDQPDGAVLGTLVLDAKGVPQASAWALVDQDRVLLLAPPEAAEHLMDVVAQRTFLAMVEFTRQDRPVTSLGAVDDEVVAAALDALAGDAGASRADAGASAVRAGDAGASHADGWVDHDDLLVVRHAFAVEVVGAGVQDLAGRLSDGGFDGTVEEVDADHLSLAVGEPRLGHEIVAGRLPEEYGLLPTHVHMAKGCYPGQEPIAHMWMLGRPRRRLARVHLAAPAHDDAEVTGHVGDRGLAFVAADAEVDSSPATGVTITGFVGDDRDVVGWTPDQTRNRDRDRRSSPPRRQP